MHSTKTYKLNLVHKNTQAKNSFFLEIGGLRSKNKLFTFVIAEQIETIFVRLNRMIGLWCLRESFWFAFVMHSQRKNRAKLEFFSKKRWVQKFKNIFHPQV